MSICLAFDLARNAERKATRPYREQVLRARPEPQPKLARDPLALRPLRFLEQADG